MKRNVDVLFINPGVLGDVYQKLTEEFAGMEPPTLAALFADAVIQNNLSVEMIDAAAEHLVPTQVAAQVDKTLTPMLVVMVVMGYQPSASTQLMPAAGAIAQALKALNPDIKIMLTGTHPAALPRKTLLEYDVDFVCDFEGPRTILQTAQQLKAGRDDFSEVESLWYYQDGNVANTPRGKLITDLGSLMKIPRWELLPMEKYRAHNWHCFEHINERSPYASIYTSLGCPYRCSFCCINAPFGGSSYRMWPAEVVIEQIDVLVNRYGVKNIKIIDEMFVLNKRHVFGICDLIVERGYDLNIWAYARVDTIKDDFLEKLALAGVRWLALGIESGSKHVRDGVEKGRFNFDDIIRIVRKIQAAGINVIGNYIFGLPDDTLETMQETLDLAVEANCEFSNFYCAMAYPGSRLYGEAKAQGWTLPESWLGYSQHAYETQPLPTNTLSPAEILEFRDQAFYRYFENDRYLALVKEKFGDSVMEHIKRMMQVDLPRKLLAEKVSS